MKSKQVQEFKETEIGKIPVDWEVTQLENVCTKITDGSHLSPKAIESGTKRIASVKDIENNDFNFNSCKIISDKDFDELERNGCKPVDGDVIFSKDGTMGLTFVYKNIQDLVLLSSIAIIRVHNQMNPYFLHFYLRNKKIQNFLISAYSSGSALPRIVLKDLKKLPVIVPKIEEQEKIAKTFSDLDVKIQNLQNQNKILEQTARVIFKSRFVDFDGVTEFEDSELGQIPKGWSVDTLDSIGKIITGKTPSTKEKDNFGNDYPFITIPDMQNSIFAVKVERYISEKGKTKIQKYLLPENSVCVSCIATPGLVTLTIQNSFTNQQINSIICKQGISPFFIFLTMKMQKDHIIALGSGGTATLNLNKTNFSLIKIVLPPSNLISDFHNSTSPMFEAIKRNSFMIVNLTKIRDALLPKLMSGEIRV